MFYLYMYMCVHTHTLQMQYGLKLENNVLTRGRFSLRN